MLLTELINKLNDRVKDIAGIIVAGSYTDYKCDITYGQLNERIAEQINPILYPFGLYFANYIRPIFDWKVLPAEKCIDLPMDTVILYTVKDVKHYKVSFSKQKINRITFAMPAHAEALRLNMETATVDEYITKLLDREYLAQIDRLNTELYNHEEQLKRKRADRDEVLRKRGTLNTQPTKQPPFCPPPSVVNMCS